jgi:hypothetical protein
VGSPPEDPFYLLEHADTMRVFAPVNILLLRVGGEGLPLCAINETEVEAVRVRNLHGLPSTKGLPEAVGTKIFIGYGSVEESRDAGETKSHCLRGWI